MGSACCVAARDRTITNGSNSEIMVRNIRYSPSWSVRWDNRRRVAGEEASVSWFSDNIATNSRFLGNKSQTTAGTNYASEESSPLESFRNLTWQKSSPSEGFAGPQSDPSVSQITSEVIGTRDTQITSKQSPTMMSSSSTHSVSSFSPSPLTYSQSQLLQPSTLKSPNLSISEDGSPFMLPGSHRRERWSFDSRCSNSNSNIDRVFFSPTNEMQTCGVCSKFLTEKSSFGGQKIISTNELAVVAILICGHVYHAECLENMTSDINRYDPACPVCTFGEKKVIKLSEKALRADLEMKSKMNRKSRSRVIDGEMNIDDIMFGSCKNSPKMSSSTSIKNSSGKPFLKRHFSFGSKGNRSLSENNFSRKKGFFWAKSSRE